jgi:hypothetical protein
VNSLTGGTWSSSAATIGTVSNTGAVIGVAAGTVTVTYEYFSGCYVTFTDTVKDCTVPPPPPDVTAVGHVSNLNQVAVFPNPASDKVTIQVQEGAYDTYTICTIAGQAVRKGKLKHEATEVDIAQLPPGVYSIRLTGLLPVATRKLVIR